MMTSRRCLLILATVLTQQSVFGDTRYFLKMRTNFSDTLKTREDTGRVLGDTATTEARNPFYEDMQDSGYGSPSGRSKDRWISRSDNKDSESSTFDPDVLNKFLEDYANKIKSSTERNFGNIYDKPTQSGPRPDLEVEDTDSSTVMTSTTNRDEQKEQDEKSGTVTQDSSLDDSKLSEVPNESLKRNKYWGVNGPSDERNGWVTLDAIPWSKSKISKWQANPSTQRPWPEVKPWNKPEVVKPWQADYPSRPSVYEHNEPSWYDRPKPHWSENNALEKPWTKPSLSATSRPSYYDEPTNQNQYNEKWPPERPSWETQIHSGSNSDIITDDRPTNFPGSYPWNKQKPSYQGAGYGNEYPQRPEENNGDWHDFASHYDNNRRRPSNSNRDRPSHFSQYQYQNGHPPTHPANGDGQWVLLSTNRGYSKSRQRSIKLESPNSQPKLTTITPSVVGKVKKDMKNDADPTIAVMTSKRQVRLTVLPSINGTNTTTSHGGLLEVERTFKSVDQSRKEYERDRLSSTVPTFLAARPIRNVVVNGRPSSSAVLAAVGAGMLPATMAMMIPMMLGRRKRDTDNPPFQVKSFNRFPSLRQYTRTR